MSRHAFLSIAINIIFDEQENIEDRELGFVLPLETTLRRRIPFIRLMDPNPLANVRQGNRIELKLSI